MVRTLDRPIASPLWGASLLGSLALHLLLFLLALLLWPQPEQQTGATIEAIEVDLVSLPAKADHRPAAAVPPAPVRPKTVRPAPAQKAAKPAPPARTLVPEQPLVAPSEQPQPSETASASPPTAIPRQQPGEVTASQVEQEEQAAATESAAPSAATAAALPGIRVAYLQSVSVLIDRQKDYPRMARKSGQQGTVQVAFSLDRNGLLCNCQVEASSGYRLLDRAAEQAIRKVRRFPPPPASLGEQPSFRIPISFRLAD